MSDMDRYEIRKDPKTQGHVLYLDGKPLPCQQDLTLDAPYEGMETVTVQLAVGIHAPAAPQEKRARSPLIERDRPWPHPPEAGSDA